MNKNKSVIKRVNLNKKINKLIKEMEKRLFEPKKSNLRDDTWDNNNED